MRLVRTLSELESAIANARPVFVPTMGALHEGHLALIRKATEIAALSPAPAPVIVSIFVNPTQFGPAEDFSRYPRQLEKDVDLAESAGAEIVFAPDVQTMYPHGESELFNDHLPDVAICPKLEDAHRPGHFAGVCQVVARVFDLVHPSAAIFGEKDYQQLLAIRAMVAAQQDRWPGLQIVAHPTVREPDGLAMSSRNAYLQPQERDKALGLWRALNEAKNAASPKEAERLMTSILMEHELQIDYAALRDAATLRPLDRFDRRARALIAVRLGKVRLIDNLAIDR